MDGTIDSSRTGVPWDVHTTDRQLLTLSSSLQGVHRFVCCSLFVVRRRVERLERNLDHLGLGVQRGLSQED